MGYARLEIGPMIPRKVRMALLGFSIRWGFADFFIAAHDSNIQLVHLQGEGIDFTRAFLRHFTHRTHARVATTWTNF